MTHNTKHPQREENTAKMKTQTESKPAIVMNTGNGVQGKYVVKVCEHPMIAELRRKAFVNAGLVGEYDGTPEAYRKLDAWQRDAHDALLSEYVKAHEEILAQEYFRNRLAVLEERKGNNLILDQGMDAVMGSTYMLAQASTYCAVGTGTTPTFTDSGAITATSAGTTVTASGAFFTAGMVGQLIRFDTGEERYITAQASTTATINSSLTIGSATLFTVWAVNQTGLASESKRTNTYLNGTGNCGTSDVSNVRTYRRTYDFTAEVANQNYTELGWAQSGTVAANLFSRTLMAGGTVSVLIGQQLRVIYDLIVTVGPAASTAGTWTIGGNTGWPVAPATNTDGNYIRNGFALGTVGTNGGVNFSDIFDLIAPQRMLLATNTILPSFGGTYTPGTFSQAAGSTLLAYTNGNFYRDMQSVWDLSSGNATNWRAISLSSYAFVFIFDQAQTKANTNTLTVRIRVSLSRTLTNP